MPRVVQIAFPLLIALGARAQEPPFEEMKRSTVRLRVVIIDDQGRRIIGWGGSGYMLDSRHVITNWHVCCQPAEQPESWPAGVPFREASRQITVAVTPTDMVVGTAIWSEIKKDLGIVRLQGDSGRPAVTFAPRKITREGQRVYALGFPGAADGMTDEAGRAEVKISDGIISAAVRANPNRPGLLSGAMLYQSTLASNPGNSGGPVFDVCGRVVATHSASARNADGVKWEIQADELLSVLPALSLRANVADSPCSPGQAGPSSGRSDYLMLGGMAFTSVLAIAAIVVASTRRGREYVKRVTSSYHRTDPVRRTKGKPLLKGVSGYYTGTVVELENGSFTLGRDSRASNLVFPEDTGNVSRRHCAVRYDPLLDRFQLEDSWSTNGTFLQNGEQIAPGTSHELKSGDRFYLGTPDNMFEVRIEEGR